MVAFCLTACNTNESITPDTPTTDVVLKNHSTTPSLIQMKDEFKNVESFSLISSMDVLEGSPNFVFGGSADGSGLLQNSDGTFSMVVNHEDNFSVSRITLDKTFKPIKGEYILNSDGSTWRLCSATLATPAEHGFGPTYLTCGESGEESRVHAINPSAPASSASISREQAGLGRLSAENALPLSKNAFAGKTVILLGDDDSGLYGGQVYLYVSNKVGDLENGSYYVMKRKDNNQKETDMKTGTTYDIEFAKVENHKSLTGAQLNAMTNTLSAIKFGRVEDLDYRKGNAVANREIYFNVTGQAPRGHNADLSRTVKGRVYKLNLNENSPLTGTLEVILDGDDKNGPAKTFQNVDNICVTQNYAYIQEDPNSYGDETHDSYIYQYDLRTKTLKVVMELDHRRDKADIAEYGSAFAKFGAWEYGALVDISDKVGHPDTFMLSIQPHTWRKDRFKGVDGGSKRPNENQGSQIVILRGLPR